LLTPPIIFSQYDLTVDREIYDGTFLATFLKRLLDILLSIFFFPCRNKKHGKMPYKTVESSQLMNILNVLLKRSQYEDNIGFTFTAPKMTLGTVTVILYKLNSLA